MITLRSIPNIIGEYLRQLDPTYQHPNYKVNFLVKISGGGKSISIIIEYDGNLAEDYARQLLYRSAEG